MTAMTDAEALHRLAELVRAGSPVPADLQALANAAIVRAVERWTMPKRKPGAKPKPATPRLVGALVFWLLRSDPDRMTRSDALVEAAAAMGGCSTRALEGWDAEFQGKARALFEQSAAGALDLCATDDELAAFSQACNILAGLGFGVASPDDFEDLTQPGD